MTERPVNLFLTFWLVLFAAALIFYATGNPPIKHILLNLIPMASAFVFALAITGIGALPIKLLMKDRPFMIRILTSFAVGIGLTGIFVFILGFTGFFRRELFLGWFLLGILLLVYVFRGWRPSTECNESFNGWKVLSHAALVLFLIPGLPFFVAPEVSIDATEYHLLIPKFWFKMGGIKFIPLLVESNYPPLAELNYLLMMPLAGEITCKCFHFVVAIFVMFLLAQFSKKLSPNSNSSFAPLMFITMPVAYIVAGWAWNDLFFTFFILLGIYFLIEFHSEADESQKVINAIFAGISMGLAACTKYTFALYFPPIFILTIIGLTFWRWKWKHIVLFFFPIGLLSLLWISKNWIFTGNPFFPFLNSIFQSPYWTENVDHYFKTGLSRYETGEWSWWTYFTFPYLLSLKPRIIDVHVGVLPLIMIPLLFRRSRSQTETILKYFVLLSVLSWLVFRTMTRSLLPVLAIIITLGSVAVQEIQWKSISLRRVCTFLIAVSIILSFYITTVSTLHLFDPIRYFIGLESKAQYLKRMSTGQPIYDALNSTNEVKQVLLVSLHNPFYLEKRALFSSCCDPPIAEILTAGTKTSSDVTRKMKRIGVSHVVVRQNGYMDENKNRLYSWSEQDRSKFEEFLSRDCSIIMRNNEFTLYRLK